MGWLAMTYPEPKASYKNEPAWFGRAKRAEGGSLGDSIGDADPVAQLKPQDAPPPEKDDGQYHIRGTIRRALGIPVNSSTDILPF